MGARRAVLAACPALLEPVMRLDLTLNEECLGAVTADIGRRRGVIKEIRARDNARMVTGEVPLAEARGYATDLRTLTRGRATFVLEFLRYELAPEPVSAALLLFGASSLARRRSRR